MGSTAALLSVIGVAALALAARALVTGSETALSLLIGSVVAVWAGSMLRHAWHTTHTPVAA